MAYAVQLSELDFCDATDVAVTRMRESARQGLCHATIRRKRSLTTRLYNDVLGASSELAVARWLGIEWSRSVNTFHSEADVGEDVDVRATDREDGRLILREKDHPYRWYMLVTGNPPNMVLRGYIRGWDAMRDEWYRNPQDYGAAWFVPQSALIAIQPDGSVPVCLRQTPSFAG